MDPVEDGWPGDPLVFGLLVISQLRGDDFFSGGLRPRLRDVMGSCTLQLLLSLLSSLKRCRQRPKGTQSRKQSLCVAGKMKIRDYSPVGIQIRRRKIHHRICCWRWISTSCVCFCSSSCRRLSSWAVVCYIHSSQLIRLDDSFGQKARDFAASQSHLDASKTQKPARIAL